MNPVPIWCAASCSSRVSGLPPVLVSGHCPRIGESDRPDGSTGLHPLSGSVHEADAELGSPCGVKETSRPCSPGELMTMPFRLRTVIALGCGDPTMAVRPPDGGARLGRSLALPFLQSCECRSRRAPISEVNYWRRFAPWLEMPPSGLSSCAERTLIPDVRFTLDRTGGRGSDRAANRPPVPPPPNWGRRAGSRRRRRPRSPGESFAMLSRAEP